jgi:putative Holliday junction resolvase
VTGEGRLLGVDFGTVRIGLAISDRDRKIASPLTTYTRSSTAEDRAYFEKMVDSEQVTAIVLGLPLHTDGREGQKALEARAFGAWLGGVTSLPVVYWDERFTTVEAERHLLDARLTKKKRKTRIDRIAAQILLQTYLDYVLASEARGQAPRRVGQVPR